MRKYLFIFVCMLYTLALHAQKYPRIYFTENKNQWGNKALYRTQLYGGYVFSEKDGLTYLFYDTESHNHSKAHHPDGEELSAEQIQKELDDFRAGKPRQKDTTTHVHNQEHLDSVRNLHAYKVWFKGMSSKVRISPKNVLPGHENYFIGKDTTKWASQVKSYRSIEYSNIYSNIDLVLYDGNGSFKYDFVVRPGGSVRKIKLEYEGATLLQIGTDSSLIINTSVNTVFELKPYAYQIINNDTVQIACKYALHKNTVSIVLGEYNPKIPVIIDPQLIFSTYTGSVSDNWGFTATYDNANNVYSGGIVEAFGYPVSLGAFQTTHNAGSWDIGIIKYDPTGANRLYATYLGGLGAEMPHSLICNNNRELLILGTTGSANFPLANAYDSTFSGGNPIVYDHVLDFNSGIDMFISRLSEDGSQLLSSTYLGGTGNDGLNFDNEANVYYGQDSLYYNYGDGARGEIMLDKEDNVYIASTTFSADFPTLNAFQPLFGGMQDGVVCKFNPTVSTLQWSSYFGGESKDAAYSVDIDENNNAFVTGGSCSQTLPITLNGLFPNRIGGTVDAFLIKVDKNNGALLQGTFYGSPAYDQSYFVRVNNSGNVFLFGQTMAAGNMLIFNAPFNNPNSGQFLASFTNNLDTLNWSTVFGSGNGRPNISPTAFEVDICNRIYLAGSGRDWAQGGGIGWYFDTHFGFFRFDSWGWQNLQGTKNMPITPTAFQPYTDGQDFYIMVLDDQAQNLDYATYFGEINYGGSVSYDGVTSVLIPCSYSGHDHVDGGTSRFDSKGYIYQSICASCGGCNGFPVEPNPGAWSTTNNSSNCNNAVMRFFIDFGLLIADFEIPELSCSSKELVFKNTTVAHYTNPQLIYTWDFGDGSAISHDKDPAHTYPAPGEYEIKLIVEDSSSCNLKDSIIKKITIAESVLIDTLPPKNICEGETTTIGITNPYDSTLTYTWEPTTGLTDPDKPLTDCNIDTTTTYKLTVSSGWCKSEYYQTVNVFKNDYAIIKTEVKINSDIKTTICHGETARITAYTNAPTKRYVFSDDANFSNILNSEFKQNYIDVAPTTTTKYYVAALSEFCNFTDIDTITIVVATNIIVATGDTLICKGDFTFLDVENLAPQYPVSYAWAPGFAIESGANTDNPLVNPTQTTDFIVQATNNAGCVTYDTVTVKVQTIILNAVVNTPISCFGNTDGAISVVAIGNAPFTYSWNDSDTNSFKNNLGKGTYTLTVTDSLGCTETTSYIKTEPAKLRITSFSATNESCKNACNGSARLTISGGTKPYSFEWSNGAATQQIYDLCTNTYTAKVIDANSCTDTTMSPISIILEEKKPHLDASASNNKVYLGQSVYLYATPFASDTITYQWTPSMWLQNANMAHAIASPEEDFTYYVKATDNYGCSNTDTVHLQVYNWICNKDYIYVPTAFTPNNDKKNDMLQVESGVITDLHFLIYDRFGEKIFETFQLNSKWDGTYLGKPLAPQVLVYYIEATCINQQKFIDKGNITIIK